jgi:hypothetical protein
VREFKTLGIMLGMRYVDSPIIVADGSVPPLEHFMLYVPSAHPGCLAPHLWLPDGSSRYDHFGPDFTLLVTEVDARGADRFAEAATNCNVPIQALAPGNARLRQRYEARFALIRPDQHVAWRGDEIPSDCYALIARVTGASCKVATRAGEAGALVSARWIEGYQAFKLAIGVQQSSTGDFRYGSTRVLFGL